MLEIWNAALYKPLLNVLVWIYNNVTAQNMGWAVVVLTVALRFLLLPLTIIYQYNVARRQRAIAEAQKVVISYKGDKVAQREETRKVMKKFKISPWAKVLSLGVQGLVLVLLYQVFIGGITGERMLKNLYPIVEFPGIINNSFYGIDIGATHNLLVSAVVGVYLLASIFFEHRQRRNWKKSEVFYLFAFPLAAFMVLWILPAVKGLFILTSLVFSDIVLAIRRLLFKPKIVNS